MLELLDCRYAQRNKFDLEKGYQPKNSIFYITEGGFDFTINGSQQHASVNDLICFPNSVYFERKITDPLSFYYVRFENTQNELLTAGKLYVEDQGRLISTLSYMIKMGKMPVCTSTLRNHCLNDIFFQIEMYQKAQGISTDYLFEQADAFLHKNLTLPITLSDIATHTDVSVSTLISHFKANIGMTPITYLISLRIKKAEFLLCDSSYTVSQIAEKCGFENSYYFSNTFKRYTGLSPREYRRKTII